MPFVLMLLVQSAAGMPAAELIAAAHARTTADVRCAAADAASVTVCGRRRADRYRVPLATHVVARRDDVAAERVALLHRTTPVQDLSPFLVGGGMAGVSMGIGAGASGGAVHVRPLAP